MMAMFGLLKLIQVQVAKFDPVTETFREYENPLWPQGGRSMMWGIDYGPDGSVWFTDEAL